MNLETLHKIGYGVYIIAAQKDGKFNGQIANAVIQVTAEPPTIAVSINRNNLTHEFISVSRKFSLSILKKETPLHLIGKFGFKSGREINKFQETSYKIGITGSPIVLDGALGFIEAEVMDQLEVGTHTVFVAKVAAAEIFDNAEPMTYAYYHEVKRGQSPKTAPTYIKEEVGTGKTEQGQKYVCKVCGYVYDPALGDPDGGIKPGTTFENLPAQWVCPICGADKSQFEKAD